MSNVELKNQREAGHRKAVIEQLLVIVKDLSAKRQLLQFEENPFLVLDLFLHLSDRYVRMHEKRIKPTIHVVQDEEVNIRACLPQHMQDRPMHNPVVQKQGRIGTQEVA